MGEGLGDGVENSLVEIGVLPADVQLDFAPALPRHVAHHAREAAKQLIARDHANFHDRALQIVEHAGLESHGVGKLTAYGLFRIAFGKFAERLLQHRLADNQLSHQVEYTVDAASVHAQNIFLQV